MGYQSLGFAVHVVGAVLGLGLCAVLVAVLPRAIPRWWPPSWRGRCLVLLVTYGLYR